LGEQDRQDGARVEEGVSGKEGAEVEQQDAEVPAKMAGGEGRRPLLGRRFALGDCGGDGCVS